MLYKNIMQELLLDLRGRVRSLNRMIVRQYNNPMNDIWDDGLEEEFTDSLENITELTYISNRMSDVYGQDVLKQERGFQFFLSGSELKCVRSYFLRDEKLFVLYIEDRTDLNENSIIEIKRKNYKLKNIKTDQGLLSAEKDGTRLSDYIWMIKNYLEKK